jgi:hypothetical protein
MRRHLSNKAVPGLLVVLLVGSLAAACTVDEDSVEGKSCVLNSPNPEEQCVQGYKCVPYPEGARCEKDKSSGLNGLRVVDHGRQASVPPPVVELDLDRAHNLDFLRRLGLDP